MNSRQKWESTGISARSHYHIRCKTGHQASRSYVRSKKAKGEGHVAEQASEGEAPNEPPGIQQSERFVLLWEVS